MTSGYKSRGLAEPHKSQQKLNERVEELAKKKGISMAQLALAWSLANEFITAPIVGTTNLDSLKELIGELFKTGQGLMVDATHIKLTSEEKQYIDEVYEPLAVVS
jgi:aryl-alcohol dehydrogenase-like predicted oxidoreductase